MLEKVIGGIIILLVSAVLGVALALNVLADMIELTLDLTVEKPRIELTSDLKVRDLEPLAVYESQDLQPALGYKVLNDTYNPQRSR